MAKKMTTKTAVVKEEKKQNITGLITIIGTNKARSLKKGKEYNVSPILAERLVKNGFATKKK
jgi:hypothetical protein